MTQKYIERIYLWDQYSISEALKVCDTPREREQFLFGAMDDIRRIQDKLQEQIRLLSSYY
jgi:hypothetical protein